MFFADRYISSIVCCAAANTCSALRESYSQDSSVDFSVQLRRLVEEGLVDYVAMDVKNSPERYGETPDNTAE